LYTSILIYMVSNIKTFQKQNGSPSL